MRRITIVLAVIGCHADKPPAIPVSTSWLQITDGDYARTHANHTTHTALPFAFIPEGVNGTQLMLQFLGTAEEHGARYASDLSITLQVTHNGTTVECISKVIVDDGAPHPTPTTPPAPEAAATADDANTTTIRPWHPEQVHSRVQDHDFMCQRHADDLVAEQPQMETTNEAALKRYVPIDEVPPAEIVTAAWHDSCHLVPVAREVTRYEHFVAAHFEPPDWSRLAHVFAEKRTLVELPPECHQIPTPAKTLQRVEADLSYDGQAPTTELKPMSHPRPPE